MPRRRPRGAIGPKAYGKTMRCADVAEPTPGQELELNWRSRERHTRCESGCLKARDLKHISQPPRSNTMVHRSKYARPVAVALLDWPRARPTAGTRSRSSPRLRPRRSFLPTPPTGALDSPRRTSTHHADSSKPSAVHDPPDLADHPVQIDHQRFPGKAVPSRSPAANLHILRPFRRRSRTRYLLRFPIPPAFLGA